MRRSLPVHYARSGGLRVAYQVVGDGPLDLVVVPGFVSHVELAWEEPYHAYFYDRLAAFSRLILFDKRGTGLSDPMDGPYTPEQRTDDIRAVMDAVGAPRAALFGVSEGATFAIHFTAFNPGRVDALLLHAPIARLLRSDDHPWGWSPRRLADARADLVEHWGTGFGYEILNPSLAGDERSRAWWARYTRNSASPKMIADLMAMHAELDVRELLPSIRTPTLITQRADERVISIEEGRYIANRVPGARLVELPGVDHSPWVGGADEVLDAIQEFLTGSRPRKRAARNTAGLDSLTRREREIIRLSLDGLTAADIATRLAISERTVESHLAHAYVKLGVSSRLELLRRYQAANI